MTTTYIFSVCWHIYSAWILSIHGYIIIISNKTLDVLNCCVEVA